MIKIKYPENEIERLAFELLYLEKLNFSETTQGKIDKLLNKIIYNGNPLDLTTLVTSRFNLLHDLNNQIQTFLNKQDSEELANYLNYTSKQPEIAEFFMDQTWLNLDSCFYCNLDSIHCFMDSEDIVDVLEFINRADMQQLQFIEGIGEKKAEKILKKRLLKEFSSINDIPVSKPLKEKIKNVTFRNSHNHFTLDHFFHKDKYIFLSLCLYNFVPCCYSCNSKFKKTIEIADAENSIFVSPSSEYYGLVDDFSFKLRFHKPLNEIKDVDHFGISFTSKEHEEVYGDFLKTFKIFGRYRYHKKEVLRLLKKKLEYPESQINEIVLATGISEDEVKEMLFGRELFDEEFSQKPLVKFKRDIAKDILIDGVI
jgi:hypothetical protein